MAKVETVKVKAGKKGEFIVINKSDFTNKHTVFIEKKDVEKESSNK